MSRYPDTNTSFQAGDWLAGAARRNPEALLLLAAGACLLMRSRGSSSSRSPARSQYRDIDHGQQAGSSRTSSSAGRTASNLREGISRAADSAADYASDIKERVSDTASAYAELHIGVRPGHASHCVGALEPIGPSGPVHAAGRRGARVARPAAGGGGCRARRRCGGRCSLPLDRDGGPHVGRRSRGSDGRGRQGRRTGHGRGGKSQGASAERSRGTRIQLGRSSRAGGRGCRDLHRCGRRQIRQPSHRSEELGILLPPPKVATVPTRASRESARNATRLEALTLHGQTTSPDGATDE